MFALPAAAADFERTGCAVYDTMMETKLHADKVAKALDAITLPREIEEKIQNLILQLKTEDIVNKSEEELAEMVKDKLSPIESAQVGAWIVARKARNDADKKARQADKAYSDAVKAKEKALDAAEAKFDEEQKWLESEKEAIKSIPRDDAYLDRVSKILERLKSAYNQMKTDLDSHKGCFSDVRTFLQDKDERLKKIDALEKEIARRRGLVAKPADPADAKADPAAPGPLGDWYVCENPEVSPVQGKFTRVDAKGFTYERKNADGKIVTGQISIDQPPPARVRINQRVEIVMTASGEALVDGNWAPNNVVAGQLPSDNGCSNIPHFKGTPGQIYNKATVRFFFGAGENAHIRMYGGEYDSRDGTRMDIYWRYKKAN